MEPKFKIGDRVSLNKESEMYKHKETRVQNTGKQEDFWDEIGTVIDMKKLYVSRTVKTLEDGSEDRRFISGFALELFSKSPNYKYELKDDALYLENEVFDVNGYMYKVEFDNGIRNQNFADNLLVKEGE